MNNLQYSQAVGALAEKMRAPGVMIPIIDTLGITVNLTELSSWTEYQKASNHHNCGKVKKQLRRLFRPSLNRRYGREFIGAQVKLQQEFLDTVMQCQSQK